MLGLKYSNTHILIKILKHSNTQILIYVLKHSRGRRGYVQRCSGIGRGGPPSREDSRWQDDFDSWDRQQSSGSRPKKTTQVQEYEDEYWSEQGEYHENRSQNDNGEYHDRNHGEYHGEKHTDYYNRSDRSDRRKSPSRNRYNRRDDKDRG